MSAGLLAALLAGAAVGLLVRPRRSLRRLAAPARRPALRLPRRRRADAARERARAAEACAALAGELRAGRPPDAALAVAASVAVGRTGAALSAAAAAHGVGGDVAGVLRAGADGAAAPGLLRGLAACWSLCAGTGSGLARAVEHLERAERDAEDRRRAVEAELAGPRATAGLLAGLPVLGALLASGLGAQPLGVLLGTAVGRVCLVLGVGLDVLGVLWTRRLLARAVGG